MAALLIGYASYSTDQQDLTAQLESLAAWGVAINRVFVDHGLTGFVELDVRTSQGICTGCRTTGLWRV